MRTKIVMGNDEFILYIRKQQHPNYETSTQNLGRKIWLWIKEHDLLAKKNPEKDIPCFWESLEGAKNIDKEILPKTATQFEFDRNILPQLYDYLDTLT